jgi:ABC-2 type transport system ATP-binding protein
MSGLDPQRRKLVRYLVLEQRRAGRTVLFSSHILSDVEIVCTRAGILRDGVIGQELVLGEHAGLGTESVEVHARGLDAVTVARLGVSARNVIQNVDGVLFVLPPGPAVHATVAAVLQAGGILESVVPRRASLEDLYVKAASGAAPDARKVGEARPASPASIQASMSRERRAAEREGVPSC